MTQYTELSGQTPQILCRKLRKEEGSSSGKSKVRVTLCLINFKKHLPTKRFEISQRANLSPNLLIIMGPLTCGFSCDCTLCVL